MKEQLIELLEQLGFEVYEQGSFTATDKYPESFFTYWNDDTAGARFYDNDEHATVWNFQIKFYSVDPAKTTQALKDAKKTLKANGWICSGLGYDVPSGKDTHAAREIEAAYIEKI